MNIEETQKELESWRSAYHSAQKKEREISWLVKTKNGHRLIFNDFNSIQWAITQKIEDLV